MRGVRGKKFIVSPGGNGDKANFEGTRSRESLRGKKKTVAQNEKLAVHRGKGTELGSWWKKQERGVSWRKRDASRRRK